jgi:Tol biopolymer transport system component
MKALKSYHFEFQGGLPSMSVRMSSNLSITGDVQLYGKGARWRVRDEGGGVTGGVGMNYDVGAGIDGIRGTGGGWWESYDGGKTWVDPPSGDTILSFLLLWLDCRWGNLFREGEVTGDPALCESLARQLDFQDGTPRLEKVGGVVTRHLVGTVGDPTAQESGQGLAVNIWVSTDITPTLRQMRVAGRTPLYENFVEGVNAMALSPDGKRLATAHGGGGVDGTIRLYDLNAPGAPQRKLTNPLATSSYSLDFTSVAFSPDSSVLAATSLVAGDKMSEGVYLWNLTQPNAVPMTRTLPTDVYSVLFQPNGNMLAARAHQAIYLWDPRDTGATPIVLPIPENISLEEIAFSPDGRALAASTVDWSTNHSRVLIYDMRNPTSPPLQLPDRDAIDIEGKLAFSPDGQLLAVAAEEQINVWNLAQPGAPVATLPGAGGQYASAAFSPDGKFLAVKSDYNQVAVWDRGRLPTPGATGSPVVTLDGGEVRIVSIAFSPDGQRLAAATDAGSVLVWMAAQALDPDRSAATRPQVFREEEVLIHKPFTLTWTWSRFNEDFGVISPPPADTIEQP